MRKILILFFSLWASLANANVSCTLPFNLQNNTVADATQVMANYNALVTCLSNAAAAGVNSDITQLLGLSTPLAPTFGGTSKFIGGTSTGAANAQVITTTPTFSSVALGYQVTFTAGFNNTAATTLNINGTGAAGLLRQTTAGVVTAIGGELNSSFRVTVEWDGVGWQVISNGIVRVAQIFDWASSTCPPGALNANSQAVSRTTFAALFSQVGGTWGAGDGSTTFNVPDLRGRATYGQDQNVGGFSNRITVAGGNFDGTVVGNIGGLQNSNSVGAHTHTDSGHTHAFQSGNATVTTAANANGFTTSNPGGALVGANTLQSGTANIQSTGGTYSILAPAAIVTKCIQG